MVLETGGPEKEFVMHNLSVQSAIVNFGDKQKPKIPPRLYHSSASSEFAFLLTFGLVYYNLCTRVPMTGSTPYVNFRDLTADFGRYAVISFI